MDNVVIINNDCRLGRQVSSNDTSNRSRRYAGLCISGCAVVSADTAYTYTDDPDPALTANFKESGRWFRQKDNKRIIDEIECYLKEYNIEYFYFISESFLSMGEKKLNEFVELYKSIKVPFWFNTRIETISHDKLEKLESINCDRISIGLESGNEFIRKKILKRNYTNEYFLEKFKILSELLMFKTL